MCVRLVLVCACGSARLGRSVCAAARLATSSPCRHLGSQTRLYPAEETTEVVKLQLCGTGSSQTSGGSLKQGSYIPNRPL